MTSLNESILTDSLLLAQQQLQGFAQSENFWTVFDSVFGIEYARAQAEAIQQAWQASDFSLLPEIQVLDGASMPGIQGGFSAQTGKIYFNSDFLAIATAEQIAAVLLEEIGHSLDSRLNVSDTPGDEGELFAQRVLGVALADAKLLRIQTEHDRGMITVDGNSLGIETATSNEFRVNTTTYNGQEFSSVTALADGGFVVTWSSLGQDSSGWGIYGQRYNANGSPASGEFRINTTPYNSQLYSSVTALADGGFVVTWSSYWQDGNGYGIYGQRYNANGSPASGEFRISTFPYNDQLYSSVTALTDGGFVVTWSSYGQDGSGWGIYGQRYNANGSPTSGEFRINATTNSDQLYSSVTALTDGGFVVTWSSYGQDGSGWGIYGQRYNANGSPTSGEFRINATTNSDQLYSSVTALTDGGFVVTWSSYGQDGSGWGIYGQRYNANGSPASGEFRINATPNSDQLYSSVMALKDGGFVVTWPSYGQDGSGWGIYGQQFNAQSNKVDSEFPINQFTSGDQFSPTWANGANSIATLTNGDIVATWQGTGAGDGYGIYARILTPLPSNRPPSLSSPTAISYTDTAGDDTFSPVTGTLTATDPDGQPLTYGIAGGTGGVTLVQSLVVDSRQNVFRIGQPRVFSAPLTAGVQYRIVVSGTWTPDLNIPNWNIDARFVTRDNWTSSSDFDPSWGETLGLYSDALGHNDDIWGAYSSNHTYSTVIQGQGRAIDFYIGDVDYANNSGSYQVSIYEIKPVTKSGVYGTLTLNPVTGQYTYTPNDGAIEGLQANVSEPFTITVSDGNGGTNSKSLNINITGVNDAPTGTATTTLAAGTEDIIYTISQTDLLTGFSDIESDSLSVSNLSANNGSLVNNNDGTWSFTPNANYNGSVNLSYNVVDSKGGSTAATQSFTLTAVNDAPILTGTKATLAAGTEDTTYTISAADLLEGFSDLESDTLSVSNLSANNGSLVNNNDGTWSFTPNVNYNGSINLTYNVVDGKGGSTAATQFFTLAAVNDVPTGSASASLVAGTEDTLYTISKAQLLAGFSDVDSNALSIIDFATSNGNFVENEDGSFTITPANNYNGAVTVNYTVSDGSLSVDASNTFNLVAVNDAPTGFASASLVAGTEDTPYTISKAQLLAGFSDVDGNALSITDFATSNGNFVENEDGSFTITPANNYNGAVSVTYKVSDGSLSANASNTFNLVAVNDAPTLTGTKAILSAGSEDSVYTISQTDLLTGFTDVEGDTLSVADLTASNGNLVNNNNGTWSFTPAANYNGSVNLTYNITDGKGGSTEATQSFTLAAVNDTPTATNESLTTAEDVPVVISPATLLGNDADVDLGDSLSISAITQPGKGGLIDNGNGTYTYTPNANYNGTDSFTYTISDRAGATSTATVNLTVNAVNDNPDAVHDIVTARQSTPKTILAAELLANDTDVEGNTLSLTKVSNAQNGTVALDSNGNVVFTANANASTASFEYSLSDGNGGTDSAIVTLLVGTTLNGGNGTDPLSGTAGDDILNGGNGNDVLLGLAGDDILSGGNGMDNLQGGEGKDRLYGGRGNDLLTGGLGSDIFVMIAHSGTDTIQDFADGEDKIGLAGGLTFGQLTIGSSNGNTLISKNGGEVLAILTDVNSSLITQADFVSVM